MNFSISKELEVDKSHLIDVFGSDFIDLIEKTYEPEFKSLDSFWDLLSIIEGGIKSFNNPIIVLKFLCEEGPANSFTIKRIELIKQFFLEYHDIPLDQFISSDQLFGYDSSAIEYCISTLNKLKDDNLIESLINFLITVVQKSKVDFREIIPFYIITIKSCLYKPNANMIVFLKFLIFFIDSVEGRIDGSRYGYEIFKYSKKKRNLRIFIDEEAIDLVIHPTKTSLFSIKNVISSIKEIPLDSIEFDVDELNDTIKTIRIKKKENFCMEPSNFDTFPSTLLSSDEGFINNVIRCLSESSISYELLKILHRLKIFDFIEKKVSYFIEPLSNPETPDLFYQYLTEFIFFHFIGCRNLEPSLELQKNMDDDQYEEFSPILEILIENLTENKHPVYNQIASIEILRLFIKCVDFEPSQFFFLINQFFSFPKCQSIVFLLAQFLALKDQTIGEINNESIKKLVLNMNQINNEALKIILKSLDGADFFVYLICDIIKNPKDYDNVSPFITTITQLSLTKYPEIAKSIIEQSQEEIDSNPCQIVCDVMNEISKVQNIESPDFLSKFYSTSVDKADLPLKKSVLRFMNQIPDSEKDRMTIIMSILNQEFQIEDFDPENSELPERRYNGLTNSGNTCYMNSILQQLNSVDLLYEMLISDKSENLRHDVQYLKILFSLMRFDPEESVKSADFCQLYQSVNPDFDVYQQQDADEFLLQLLEHFPKDCQKVFEGKIINIIESHPSNGNPTSTDEVFMTIPLSLNIDHDLDSSLKRYLKRSPIYDDGVITAYRKTELKKLPQILIFHLHRFSYSQGRKVKINSFFEFPFALNMDEYAVSEETEPFGIYRLKGVVIHSGNAIGGHYMSIVKYKIEDAYHWLLFNDSDVTEISSEVLSEMSFGDQDGIQSAYLLFYEKEI